MPRTVPAKEKIFRRKDRLTQVAQTSHYLITFGGFGTKLSNHLARRGIDRRFIGDDLGILCSAAELPGSSFATADIRGNYQGIVEKMAHTRQFVQMNLEFMVDRDYKSLKFLEHWMEFISSGSEALQRNPGHPTEKAYHIRMRYPDEYKTDQTKIVKFERDFDRARFTEYTFIGLFPISLNAVPVMYANSQVLKATAIFSYDRYVAGETSSLARAELRDLNRDPSSPLGALNAFAGRYGGSVLNGLLNRDVIGTVASLATGGGVGRSLGQAVSTLGGSTLGQGSSSTFEMF